MKKTFPITVLLMVSVCLTTLGCGKSTADATNGRVEQADGPQKAIAVFISLDADDNRTKLVKKVVFDALEAAEAGTRWHVFLGVDHKLLASFDIPEATGQRRFRELKAVLPHFHTAFDQIDDEANGQVNVPALAGSVKKQLTTETECHVAIYGSPRYLDPDQDAFQHDLVYVTKDGSVDHELSPFQTSDKLPKNCRVVWVTPQTKYGYDERHMSKIRHFNGYYIQELGGTLLRTTEDASLLFDFQAPEAIERIAMNYDTPGKFAATAKTIGSGDSEIQTVNFTAENMIVPGSDVEDSPEATLSGAEHDKGTIALAINWTSTDDGADYDMYLKSNGLPGELSFISKTTSWGKHFKDVTSSSTTDANVEDYRNWEWISVDHARLHDLVLYINAFRTSAPARVTVVRVWNGERKVRVIDLMGSEGDAGRNRNNRGASTAWHRVALHRITDGITEPDTL